ncbi:MAG: SAM-dependent methyltransferase [Archangium gephyra]|uniref:SAM-dependent methyltransferase n=1 Tax=Archangium gephyra TaxID=48 RepID=A0A2W5VFF8_9BACT|nr:MAG: SAM-dependent methyltransferase [Archangium gephyra]
MSRREVHTTEAVAWLRQQRFEPGTAVVTSMPDSSEIPSLGFDGWRTWFSATSELICRNVSDEDVAIFYQTDVKHDGRWVDKGFLVSLGAERAGSHCLWHKVICRAPAGMTTFGRPAYAHLLCFSRTKRLEKAESFADVLPQLGEMTWARAMGLEACDAIAKFLVKFTKTRTVVDPFCGVGTMLAVANEVGLDAVGVELSAKRAEKARTLMLKPRLR